MKVRFPLVFCAGLFSAWANAQIPDRIEVFGGYSHVGYYYYQAYQGLGPFRALAAGRVRPR